MEYKQFKEQLTKRVEALSKSHITVGVQAERGNNVDDVEMSAGDEMLKIANVHEYGFNGTDKNGRKMNIPERSYIRTTLNNMSLREDVRRISNTVITSYLLGEIPLEEMWKTLGHEFVTDIVSRMSLDKDALLEETQKQRIKKGYAPNTPLVASGELQDHVTYVIHEGGKK